MIAVKGIFRGGQIMFAEPPPDEGPVEVLVVFPEEGDDPWREILEDPTPRPGLAKVAEELLGEMARGETEPLDFDKL